MNFQLGPKPPRDFVELILRRDVPIHSNFIIACILILVAPLLNLYRSASLK
jgi:hypothetical protein